MLRCAIVPPVPVPYREPLLRGLAARTDLFVKVIYQASGQPSWDQPAGWFPDSHGYEAVRLAPRHIARPGRSPITWPRGLERELSRFDPDVVVVSEFGPATLRSLAWCRLRRRALVVLSEVTSDVERTLSAPQRRLHRLLAKRVDGLIAVSTAARERLLALGVAAEEVIVSMQPLDEESLLAATRERHAAGGHAHGAPVEVITVARLVPDQDVGTLIDAFAASGLREEDATLSIVGGGPMDAELRDRARQLGVPARFAGALSASELPARYAAADVFALPSRYEPFGVALREAVVAGLPVICSSAVGAAHDLAHDGLNAILVEPGDVGALAHALRRLCRDPQLRASMGAASSAIARRHPLACDVEAFARAVKRAASLAGR